jgi:hypothetical protein
LSPSLGLYCPCRPCCPLRPCFRFLRPRLLGTCQTPRISDKLGTSNPEENVSEPEVQSAYRAGSFLHVVQQVRRRASRDDPSSASSSAGAIGAGLHRARQSGGVCQPADTGGGRGSHRPSLSASRSLDWGPDPDERGAPIHGGPGADARPGVVVAFGRRCHRDYNRSCRDHLQARGAPQSGPAPAVGDCPVHFLREHLGLLALSASAQSWCRRHGVKVGLLGPIKESIEELRRMTSAPATFE